MNTFLGVVSVGFSRFGEEVTLSSDQITRSVTIIGEGGEEIGARVGIELHYSGRKVLELDIAGRVATGLSGCIQTFDWGYLMKDAFKVEEEGGHLHAQLVASALAIIFNLPSAQESILNSIATSIAAEQGCASPGGMYDAANLVGGFRATDKEEVEGRLGSLQLLNATGELGSIREVAKQSAVVSFSGLPTPELAEAGSRLYWQRRWPQFQGE